LISYVLNIINYEFLVKGSLVMKSMIKSKKGISPILATLLLIVIAVAAVIVTYAWVITFTESTTSQAGAILTVENIRFDTATDDIVITIRNSGTADGTVDSVYVGTSSSNLVLQSASDVDPSPANGIVEAGSTLTLTISNYSWTEGETYYFNIGTEEGMSLPFSREA
jgi:archaeal type IV pilus assembly protein PilA